MTKYSVRRMGKHTGTSYLSLGNFVYHEYNYVVTGSHINDISRHFTPKLIRYLRNLYLMVFSWVWEARGTRDIENLNQALAHTCVDRVGKLLRTHELRTRTYV